MKTALTIIGAFFAVLIPTLLLNFFVAWIVMLLWNWVAPIFWADAPTLTYWVTYGALWLLHFLRPINIKRPKD